MSFISTIFFLVSISCCCCANSAFALTFTEALELARKNDPAFLIAQDNYQVAQERFNIASSALRPQLNISGTSARNHRRYLAKGVSESFFEPLAEPTTDSQTFNSNNVQINLTQALWRHAERIASAQADLVKLQGENQVLAAEQDLFVRFLQAWFDAMSARDNIHFTAKQSAAALKLRSQTTRAAEIELASEAELEDALARHEKALAEEVAAAADEEAKISALEQIIGSIQHFTSPLLTEQPPMDDFLDNPLSHWLDLAETSNPAITAATYGVHAANEEISKQRAGHEPTLDITGSYGYTSQGAGTTPTQQGYTNAQGTIGLQLNIPIFSGGGQSAKVREAISLRGKATQELESARRGVRSTCKQAWFGIQSGIARHKAATYAVKSATTNLQAATSGQARELKTELDVLQATQQVYGALRDLQNARYDIMLNKIKLKATAGQLTMDDVIALNAAFLQSTEDSVDQSSLPQQPSPVAFGHTYE